MMDERPQAPDIFKPDDGEVVFGIRVARHPEFPGRFVGYPFGAYGGLFIEDSVAEVLTKAARAYDFVTEAEAAPSPVLAEAKER